MPVIECINNDKPGYKWGESGKCYTYDPNNEQSKNMAKAKAERQGRAIEVNKIEKYDDDQLVFGWANISIRKDGEQIVDHQGHAIDVDELENASYLFNLYFRETGEMHVGKSKGKLVESIVFTKEKMEKMGIPENTVPEGWWLGFFIDDREVYEKVKNGEYNMFSIQGTARKEVIDNG